MFRALSTAATGMIAQERRVDVIANNLANVNTAGFKKARAEFQDLLYDQVKPAGAEAEDGSRAPSGIEVGLGVRVVATQREFSPGSVRQTDNPLDLSIEGDGFFAVRQTDGQIAYTRDGAFRVDAEGNVVNAEGLALEPGIVIPADAEQISVVGDGTVNIIQAGAVDPISIGRIELATFINPAGLQAQGHSLFLPSPGSGSATVVTPGLQGSGSIMQGALELSNVKAVEEMVDLIASQRAYETNSKVIRAADEMLQTTANLR